MKPNNFFINLLFVLFYCTGFGQPGGGGGLYISKIFTKNLQQINIKDSNFKVRYFEIKNQSPNNDSVVRELFPDQSIQDTYSYYLGKYDSAYPPIYIPTEYWWLYHNGKNNGGGIEINNQRLLFVFNQDSMLVDFGNIITENGMGASDVMDSLIIKKGYFNWEENRNKTTFTRTSYQINVSKINNYDVTADAHLYKSEDLCHRGLNIEALEEIKKAIDIGLNNNEQQETTNDLFNIYKALGRNEDALKETNKLIEKYPDKVYYEERKNIYILLKQYKDALNDYNSIVKYSTDVYTKNFEIKERAMFKADYLKDYHSAIEDLKGIINAEPDSLFTFNRAEFASTYFKLGLVESKAGKDNLAYKYWLKAMEFLNPPGGTEYYIHIFDSLILKHPKIPGLYLSRAIAYSKECVYPEGQVIPCYQNILSNIDTAKQLGLSNYNIYFYKALALFHRKRYVDAIKQINIAISMDSIVPYGYFLRCDIENDYYRFGKGPKLDFDVDIKKYRELNKTYRVKKW